MWILSGRGGCRESNAIVGPILILVGVKMLLGPLNGADEGDIVRAFEGIWVGAADFDNDRLLDGLVDGVVVGEEKGSAELILPEGESVREWLVFETAVGSDVARFVGCSDPSPDGAWVVSDEDPMEGKSVLSGVAIGGVVGILVEL